jgi:hypothetical protein
LFFIIKGPPAISAKNLVTVRAVLSQERYLKLKGAITNARELRGKKLKNKLGLEDVKSNGRKLKHGTVKDKFRCAIPGRHEGV